MCGLPSGKQRGVTFGELQGELCGVACGETDLQVLFSQHF